MNPDLTNYGWGLPVQASSHAVKIDWSLSILHWAMIVIFVSWALYMVFCLIYYREKKGVSAKYSHHTTLKSYIPDVLILAFEIWLIFIIGIPIWANIREELPAPEDATVVNVVAEQFVWNIHYPGEDGIFGKRESSLISSSNNLGIDPNDPNAMDDITTINQLAIPIGKPVLINLTAKDVIHSFFVPEFRTKQDAVPGMKIPMWVDPILLGHFELSCAQLCGLGHYRMRGDVYVKTPEEFQKWLKTKLSEKVIK